MEPRDLIVEGPVPAVVREALDDGVHGFDAGGAGRVLQARPLWQQLVHLAKEVLGAGVLRRVQRLEERQSIQRSARVAMSGWRRDEAGQPTERNAATAGMDGHQRPSLTDTVQQQSGKMDHAMRTTWTMMNSTHTSAMSHWPPTLSLPWATAYR